MLPRLSTGLRAALLLLLCSCGPALLPAQQTVTVPLTGRYLHLPVQEEGETRRMSVRLGDTLREFDIILADGTPDFYAFLDVSDHRGASARITYPTDAPGLALLHSSDTLPGADSLYREAHRPRVHFSSRRGWLNDPNGLVRHAGRYHLYYQHNPYGWAWGNMHWGHASSPDLLHWTEHPVAIYPHRYGDWAFSGSAVVDHRNTSGLGRDGVAPLVAIYTSTGRGECLQYSLDGGMTFREYAGNPVVKHHGRDPKVFWYEPQQKWVMVVFDESPQVGERGDTLHPKRLAIYDSPNLRDWTYRSAHGPFWECPELFELPLDGDSSNTRWIMHGGNAQYQIGRFDGYRFTPETPRLPLRHGMLYAAQTWNDAPDGRRLLIGWATGVATPGMPFNRCMTFPVELRLVTTPLGPRLRPAPVREIRDLHGPVQEITNRTVDAGHPLSLRPASPAYHLQLDLEIGDAWEIVLTLNEKDYVYRVVDFQLNGQLLRPTDDGRLRLEVIVDRSLIEIFGNDGALYWSDSHQSTAPSELRLTTRNPDWQAPSGARVKALKVWPLRSVWE